MKPYGTLSAPNIAAKAIKKRMRSCHDPEMPFYVWTTLDDIFCSAVEPPRHVNLIGVYNRLAKEDEILADLEEENLYG